MYIYLYIYIHTYINTFSWDMSHLFKLHKAQPSKFMSDSPASVCIYTHERDLMYLPICSNTLSTHTASRGGAHNSKIRISRSVIFPDRSFE